MTKRQFLLGLYLNLANYQEQSGKQMARDKCLVLAGSCAATMHLTRISDYCRYRILESNKAHFVGRYASFAEALADPSFDSYLRGLHRAHPVDQARATVWSLGINVRADHGKYPNDEHFAAAVLRTTPEQIAELLDRVAESVDEDAVEEKTLSESGPLSGFFDDLIDDDDDDLEDDEEGHALDGDGDAA